ncbi:NTP transferase domain-containing protein [Candidatus Woesearchaeota archaeon]|nr:NTP transferase domain-containing protein [Candidatus Woesearchaeota archaeon]MBL7050621.1 NTP transferase domain-containing protein [Candidatus Woesearchaeota archaeon]
MATKIVIMAAGKGTRMMPLTRYVPKTLINVGGKPFLYYLIKNVLKAGYTEIGIVVGYKKEKIQEFLKDFGFKAKLMEQKKRLGTGHALKQIKGFVEGEDFVVIGGDNLWSTNDLKAMRSKSKFCYIAGMEHPSPEKYGVLLGEEGILKKIVEKPKSFVGNLINVGLYKFTKDIFDALDKIEKSERGEYELTDAISLLASQGKVKVMKLKDYWLDLGCLDDIPIIEQFLTKKV